MAKIVEPFLIKFQRDDPLLPFLADDLLRTVKNMLRIVIEPEEMKNITSVYQLLKVDFADKDIYLSARSIETGAKANAILNKLFADKKISERQVLQFKMDCKKFVMTSVEKMLAKSPINYSLVRSLTCLNPNNLANKQDLCRKRFKNVLIRLSEAGKFDKMDEAAREFNEFLDDVVDEKIDLFEKFDSNNSRLDKFWFKYLNGKDKYKNLWEAVRKCLLLSHGQAEVERGFSINKHTIQDNLSNDGLTAKRVVGDFIRKSGGIDKIKITPQMIVSCASSRSRYREFLRQQEVDENARRRAEKRKTVMEELDELKAKRKRLHNEMLHLRKLSESLADKAGDAKDAASIRKLIAESNSHRHSAKRNEDKISKLDGEINEVVIRIKSTE